MQKRDSRESMATSPPKESPVHHAQKYDSPRTKATKTVQKLYDGEKRSGGSQVSLDSRSGSISRNTRLSASKLGFDEKKPHLRPNTRVGFEMIVDKDSKIKILESHKPQIKPKKEVYEVDPLTNKHVKKSISEDSDKLTLSLFRDENCNEVLLNFREQNRNQPAFVGALSDQSGTSSSVRQSCRKQPKVDLLKSPLNQDEDRRKQPSSPGQNPEALEQEPQSAPQQKLARKNEMRLKKIES